MNIDRVRYFQVFAQTGSLVKASEILHISQPALSKALKLLEQEVGTKLLEADGRGLKLTGAGNTFKNETAPLLERWLQIPKSVTNKESVQPTKIGSFEVFTTYFLGHLTQFLELSSLEVHEYGPGRLEEAIADQIIDVGITYIPIPKPELEFLEVTKIAMGIFGLKKYKHTPVAALPFVVPLMPLEGTPSKMIGLDGWPNHKISRNIKYRVTMMESAMELCRSGHCVAYLPTFVVDLHNQRLQPDYKFMELASPIPQKLCRQSVYLIHRKHTQENSLHRKIARSLRSLS